MAGYIHPFFYDGPLDDDRLDDDPLNDEDKSMATMRQGVDEVKKVLVARKWFASWETLEEMVEMPAGGYEDCWLEDDCIVDGVNLVEATIRAMSFMLGSIQEGLKVKAIRSFQIYNMEEGGCY